MRLFKGIKTRGFWFEGLEDNGWHELFRKLTREQENLPVFGTRSPLIAKDARALAPAGLAATPGRVRGPTLRTMVGGCLAYNRVRPREMTVELNGGMRKREGEGKRERINEDDENANDDANDNADDHADDDAADDANDDNDADDDDDNA